jgi:hypothetical protein
MKKHKQSGSRISPVVHQLSCSGVGFSLCWFTRGLFLCSSPFSGARSVICQLAPCCQRVVMVCWSFLNFAVSFDIGCCSLTQEMSLVDCYLPYFRQWLITHQLSCFLSVMWHAEAFYGLRVHGIKVLIVLDALFLPSVTPVSQQVFWFMELMMSASIPCWPSWFLVPSILKNHWINCNLFCL